MKTSDFAAFRRKMLTPAAALLELREAPTIQSIADSLDKIAPAFDEFKREQREKMEKIETRLARPGAAAPAAPAIKQEGPALIDTRTGRPMIEIRRGDDIEAKYREAGLITSDGQFSTEKPLFGDFLRAVAGQKSSELALKALSVGTDSAGGYMVPSVLMPGVLDALTAASSLLQAGSRVIPVGDPGDGGKTYTMAAVNAVPTAAWRAENGSVAESDPSFRAVVATPRSLAFYFKVSRELLNDAANLERALPLIIGQAFAVEMDRAGLRGTGTAPEPRGVLNTVGIQAVTNGANGASLATLRWANLLSAVQAILTVNGPMPTAAIMAPRSLVGFGSLVDTTNQPLALPDLLRNLDMIATSQIPVNLTVGSSSDCTEVYVGDFTRTAFVMRESVSIQRLNELYAGTGQVGFMCHARVDFVTEYPTTLAVATGVRP
jgi:HK97 family phage major capsid protein